MRPVQTIRRRRLRGLSLIEVLVSLLVFSLGVLGLAGFQALLTRQAVEASERSRAALMANELVAEMWKARRTELDSDVVSAWEARVQDPAVLGLPGGEGEVTALDDDAGTVLIEVRWTSVVRGSQTSTYITEFSLPPFTED